ncbi:MAG: hypothetical protein CMH49_06865 [Myxococcales bacterium]|nr:hypothetical protein [Myxococcales bacterium]
MSQTVDPPLNATSNMTNESDQTLLESTRSRESLELNFKIQAEANNKFKAEESHQAHLTSSINHLGLEKGFILPGRYQVNQALGKGGYGSVYAGTDLNLDRAIAIKLLNYELEGRAAQRFKDEGRLIAKLQHPHIIQVYAFNELDFSCPFLVMEHFGTGSLKDHWQKSDKPMLKESCHIIIQVLDALNAAHQIGVVHRDIKEANILYDHHKEIVKLCDFGIARAVERLEDQAQTTKEGCVIGTGHYIAPERYKGQNHDPRSDLYSVGVLFYRLLTGRRPHESYYGEPLAPGVVMYRSSYEAIDHVAAVPRSVERVCLRLLERDINLRYQDAQQAKSDLLEALHSSETQSYEYEIDTHDPLDNDTHLDKHAHSSPIPNTSFISDVKHTNNDHPTTQALIELTSYTALLKRSSAPLAFLLGIILFILFWTVSSVNPSRPRTVIKLGTLKTKLKSATPKKAHVKSAKSLKLNTKSPAQGEQSQNISTQLKISKPPKTARVNGEIKPTVHMKVDAKSKSQVRSKARGRTRTKAQPKTKSGSPYVFPVKRSGEASLQD